MSCFRLVEYLSSEESLSEKSPIKINKKLTRKKQRNPKDWKQSINKDLTEKGLEHVSAKVKIIPAKIVNFLKFCNSCAYNCLINFDRDEIISIHDLYYSLSRKDKLGFILNYTSLITSKSKKIKGQNFIGIISTNLIHY